jgi:GntR family transcriptional regulator
LKFNPNIPIYIQIINDIKKNVVTGLLARGERIDSVRALSEKYEVNLNTMQRACAELERQQVIFTQRGIGSFVTEEESVIAALKGEMSGSLVEDFINEMKDIGYNQDEIVDIVGKALKK